MEAALEVNAADATPSSKNQLAEMTTEKLKFRVCQEVDQYGDKLLQRLDVFRKKNMFYDVTLKTTDADLAAHKVVLAACGGMFRSHFVDAKTKRIDNSVTEVTFGCPATGLRTILKFAYSGVLEITQGNVLPTLLAAMATEMKEVQDICSDLSMSRLGWILHFDGTEKTLSSISIEGKTNRKHEDSLPLEHAYILLHRLLEFNAPNFASNATVEDEALTNCTEKPDDVLYPCLKDIESRWPTLRHVYISMIQCLRKAEALDKSRHDDPGSHPVKTNAGEEKSGDQQSTEKKVPCDVKKEDADETEATASSKSEKSDVKSSEVVLPTNVNPAEKTAESGTPVQEKKAPRPAARSTSSAESPKPPVSKPRTMKTHMRNDSSDKGETKKQPPPSPPKDSPKPAPHTPVASKAPQKRTPAPETPPSSSPVPPRRKHAAPKPPGPPPAQANKVSSSPSFSRDTPSKAPPPPKGGKSTPSPAQKIPPPRPKPPSIKKKGTKSEASVTTYDDKMNPFADEDDEDIATNNVTKDSAQKKDTSTSKQEDNYDDSLNPFGE